MTTPDGVSREELAAFLVTVADAAFECGNVDDARKIEQAAALLREVPREPQVGLSEDAYAAIKALMAVIQGLEFGTQPKPTVRRVAKVMTAAAALIVKADRALATAVALRLCSCGKALPAMYPQSCGACGGST